MNTDPTNINTQVEDKPTEVKMYLEIAVQTSNISSEDFYNYISA